MKYKKPKHYVSSYMVFLAIIILAQCLTACGAGGGGGNTGSNTTTGIGPNGGTVTSSDGKAKVVIPAGALTGTANITVTTVSNQPSGNIGTAFEIGPDGATFSQPITISVTYDEASLPSGVNESDLRLGTVINNKWEALSNSTVDTTANVISGTITHLSIYGMLAVSSSVTVPSSPTGISAIAADGQATVTWDPVTGATSYNVYMASQSGVTKSNYSTLLNGMVHSNVTSPYIHTGLTNGTTYYFIVTAVNADGESAESSEGSTTPATSIIIPNTPDNLQATAISSTQINLSWTDNSADEDGFKIERKTGAGGTYSQIAAVVTNIKNYSDSAGLTANTAYCYKVRAFNSAGDSGYSNESCTNTLPAATAPSAPTGITATAGDGQVTISWNSVPDAISYNVYMASQSGVTKSNYSTLTGGMKHSGVTSPYVHTGLTNGTSYYFVVTALNAIGESIESLEVFATPKGTVAISYKGVFSGIRPDNMITGRNYHTATLLPYGKVLIAGGVNDSGPLSTAELYDPTTGAFTLTGSMDKARGGHTATLLSDGKVLIVGGWGAATAELYDPFTGTFIPTGISNVASFGKHTATLLPNGKVLIAGGSTNKAELYDPSTGTFSLTGSMSTKRSDHSATLLSNGKVLIAGGRDWSVTSSGYETAELYDPSTGTFTSTGSMKSTRTFHTAILLSNGKVLIVGGLVNTDGKAISTAELYDTTTGTFTLTGSMSTERSNHSSTLLSNGNILIVGGYKMSGYYPYKKDYLGTSELYDPSTGLFTSTGSMTTVRLDFTATLLPDGNVLIAGTGGGSKEYLRDIEIYTPSTKTFIMQSSCRMTRPRSGHSAILLSNGKVFISGNDTSTEIYDPSTGVFSSIGSFMFPGLPTLLSNGEFLITNSDGRAGRYNPTTGVFTPIGSMNNKGSRHTATLLSNGKVLIIWDIGNAELYDPVTNVFTSTGGMSTKRNNHIATLLPNGKILIAGGSNDSGILTTAELFDFETGKFSKTPGNMITGHLNPIATATLLSNGKVLIAGGNNNSSAELYDPATSTFTPTGNMKTTRGNHTATLLPDGKVLIVGGGGNETPSAELYDPSTGVFTNTGSMSDRRASHTATLLPDGKVLIAGGYKSWANSNYSSDYLTLSSVELFQ